MIKSVDDVPVHTLLSVDSNVVYHVPKYQREYSWSRNEWDTLIDDFLEADDGHFLGTIICINATVNSTEQTILEVVDGQQRLTTVSLLLAAICSLIAERKDVLTEEGQVELLNLRRHLVLKGTGAPRLLPQDQNSNLEDYRSVLGKAGLGPSHYSWYSGVRRVEKCFNHFRSRLEGLADEREMALVDVCWDVLARVKSAVMVKLEVDNHSDAFVLFESLNNRGMPLTPIDLIKNLLLARADRHDSDAGVDRAFEKWKFLLADLGDDYATQERFFRQYYNAFKSTLPDTVLRVPVATRSNILKVYESLIDRDHESALKDLVAKAAVYRRILGVRDDDADRTALDAALDGLARAQSAPAYIVLLRLMSRDEDKVEEVVLVPIVKGLTSFFVRRNLTGAPPTYLLTRLFMEMSDSTSQLNGPELVEFITADLRRLSASDEAFVERLHGPVYEENTDLTRYILIALAERAMTRETQRDLWERVSSKQYLWTIEHVLPQGNPLPAVWSERLGGVDEARKVQQEVAHSLGNLTISGYNSHLGNKSFEEKRDRTDSDGRQIGYRNGLSLNADIVDAPEWGRTQIEERTHRLARAVIDLFPL